MRFLLSGVGNGSESTARIGTLTYRKIFDRRFIAAGSTSCAWFWGRAVLSVMRLILDI
jgi:hypothetical protein